MQNDHRIAKLAALLKDAALPAAAFVPGPNFYYLTGVSLHLMERPTILLITADGDVHAVIPALERDRWSADMPDAQTIYWQDADGYTDAIAALARQAGVPGLGVESGRMRHFEAAALETAFGFAVTDATQALAPLRMTKEPAEIDAMSRAIALSEAALSDILPEIAEGMTETEIRARLQIAMLERGADGPAFDLIVLCGGAAADCHGVPSRDRRLTPGDSLLFDFGATLDGYSADITRTFFFKTVSDRHRDIYETVLAANTLGRSMAGPGVTYDALDRAVLDLLADRGYGDMIRHKTGHGLGLDIHELPQVMTGNSAAMTEGTVFTIEPGLYAPNEVGVRIEDDVLVTTDGVRSLTSFPRELTVLS